MSTPVREARRQVEVVWHSGCVARAQRWELTGQHGVTVWLTGLPAAGKSTIAYGVEDRLVAAGRVSYVLDGDNLRHGLNRDLGFDPAARTENVRRTAEVATLLCDVGAVTLVSLVSPYSADRERARAAHQAADLPFLLVHVATDLSECERRDPKGLYRRARSGDINGLTGVDAPYEPPEEADLVVGRDGEAVANSVKRVVAGIAAVTGGITPPARRSCAGTLGSLLC